MTSTRWVFVFTALMILVADIVTKRIIVSTFQLHEVQQVVGDYIRLTYIHNPGAAFGLFPGSRFVLIGISVAAAVVVVSVAWNRSNGAGTIVPLGFILGGALGNLIDRVRLGEVVDFVQIGIPPNTYWPVFNVADSAVTVGVTWLAVSLVFAGKHRHTVPQPDEVEPEEKKVAGVAPSGDEA